MNVGNLNDWRLSDASNPPGVIVRGRKPDYTCHRGYGFLADPSAEHLTYGYEGVPARFTRITGGNPKDSYFIKVSRVFAKALSLRGWQLPHAFPTDRVDAFLSRVYNTLDAGEIDRAIDLVFEEIDTRLNQGDIAGCGDILKRLEIDRLDLNLIVSFLVITLPVKDKIGLPRRKFVGRARTKLAQDHTPEEIQEILKGLE